MKRWLFTTPEENKPQQTPEQLIASSQRQEQLITTLGTTDDTGIFTGARSLPVADGISSGFIAKSKLTLSKDVEQFKQGADKNGIARKLVGEWKPDAAPISVWKRKDGRLEVISGRHRFAHCPTQDIACLLYEENDTHNLDWAKQHDVENNIRDGQATAYEIARYTKDTALTMADATNRGIAREGSSLKGIQLGIHSTTETLDALKNNLITEDDAYRTAMAFPSNTEAQRTAIATLIDGSSWSEAYNTATAKLAIQAIAADNANNGMQLDIDLFGDTDTEALYRHIGHYATKRQAELGKEITAINGASKNPSIAKKYGIDVQNPESTRQAIAQLQATRAQWKNFALHPNLLQEANNYAKTKLTKIDDQKNITASRQIDETLIQHLNHTTFSVTAQDKDGNILHPDTFLTKKDGNIDWLYLKKGKDWKPVRLRAGEDKKAHRGYGLTHIVASRSLDTDSTLWGKQSPEQYLSDILSNVSELYEMTGREVLVKGKKPSQWLLIQLVEDGGFYSIVTAYPVSNNKKPTGKRVQLRSATSALDVDQADFDEHNAYKTTSQSPNTVSNSKPNLPNGSNIVNIKDVICRFDDGSSIQASFSIIGSNAASFLEYKDQGLTYLDPADQKEKAIINTEGISLRKQKLTVPQGSVTHTSLAALLHHPELYRAYPDVAKYRVSIYNDPDNNTSGAMFVDSAYISINTAHGDSTTQLNTLLHEVQHAIQQYEGFARGSSVSTKEEALTYLTQSIQQLKERKDEWSKHQLPILRSLYSQVESNKTDPQSIYLASHGEQEARLAGALPDSENQGKNGYTLLGIGGNITVPLTGEWRDLGAITFTKSPYTKLLADKLSPQGDWIYDTLIFKIRASLDRTAKRLSAYTNNQDDGLELYAQAVELITSIEKYLPKSYGMALEPYKIWINTFATLHGSGDINKAVKTLPMSKWDDIMTLSFTKAFHDYVAQTPALLLAHEALKAENPETADAMLFQTHGPSFLKQYGKDKIDKLIARFLDRTVEHIDNYRKDKTLGKIRRITSSLTPKHDKKGKPLKGKITADQYRKLDSYIRLIEFTESEYNNYFEVNYNDNTPEEQRYENLPPDHPITLKLEDSDGKTKQYIYTKQEFEAYACWQLMNVNTAERAAAALGEFISTSRNAWENAQLNKQAQTESMLTDLLASTGDITETQLAQVRNKSKLTPLPKETLSILDVFMNLGQYADILSKYPELKTIANNLKQRASKASTNIEYAELKRLQSQQQIIASITGITDRYKQSDWLYEHKRTRDSKITITAQEPDYKAKANTEYQDRLLKLLRRKEKAHGLEAMQPYLTSLQLTPETRALVNARYTHPSIKPTQKQITKAIEHQNRVFTEEEWQTYSNQEKFTTEKATQLKEKAKKKEESTQTLNAISRDSAAYIILLCEQKSYTEMMRQKGYTEEVVEQLKAFVGEEGMSYAYALRELLNTRSSEIQQLVEQRYGTPFPLEDNYFRAYFDASPELSNKSIADGSSFGDAANAGTYGSIHIRRKHNAPIDLTLGASSAFMAAADNTSNKLKMEKHDELMKCMREDLGLSTSENTIFKLYGL